MRIPLLIGFAFGPLAVGCMAAAKSEPPPHGPEGSATVTATATTTATAPVLEVKKAEILKQDSDLFTSTTEAESPGGLGMSGSGKGGGGIGDGVLGGLGAGQGFGGGGGGGSAGKGRVAAATATTSGAGLPSEVIAKIVRANVARIQVCYEKAMTKNPSLAGKVAVKFVIDGTGAVSSASAADTNIADADMVSCVIGAVKGMSFPQPDGGSPVVVTYPFNFSSGDN